MSKQVTPDASAFEIKLDRSGPKLLVGLTALLAIGLSLFQLYTAGINPLGLFFQRSIHLAAVMMLAFLIFPPFRNVQRGWFLWGIDLLLFMMAAYSGFYLVYNLDEIFARAGFWTREDIWVGVMTTLVLLEASRRAVGMGLTVIGIIALLYAFAGPRGELPWLGEWLPGVLNHRGYTLDRVAAQMYLGQEGIFGIPLGVAATFVFIFVLFGAMLEVTGAGKFFIDLAFSATGRQRGGPAKAAVIASASMGSISGSSIANVVTSGAFTIPLMKKLGYKPAQAGGIEAAASTGGQIMPPLMGAGAFLIAEYTRVPYIEIIKVSVFPALLYFATVYLFVHIIAVKQGMKGLAASELPQLKDVMARGWYFLVPLIMLVYLLVMGYSPMRVGFYAVVGIIVIAGMNGLWRAWQRGRAQGGSKALQHELWQATLDGTHRLVLGLELGARNAVAVSIACGVAGIVVAVVGLTGLGLKFSSMMIAFSGGNLLLAVLLVALASLILGLGLPVTASYIVLIVLVGPALTVEFGVPLLVAHLLVFWYSQDSNVTPPVALAAFAAAAIAGSKTMETSVQSWKFAKGLYLIPLFFVFNPELITGGPMQLLIWKGAVLTIALLGFAASIEGYLFTWVKTWMRAVLMAATVVIFYPVFWMEAVGAGVILLLVVINLLQQRMERQPGAA
ncbi:TRAP transporter permease [Marinospirillum alkaliphilum]|uniref:TRAP transporter, 4TM/12TM fusion protein n=1 Tax=Marinospirillum alkaliphilum DSM 21637 TaxID=1122209 RepID=A0A1K1XXG9_9GAMM|nr:TRAP transporter fused permease subunit [Marinospirillum alkaliphilum]SFX54327.1 TRAP transporter, 4TM/12TM fusion protein [Marinospirillum alkaliphilum DSM 21637]